MALTKWGLYILVALKDREMHGYAIRQEIERLSEGTESISLASLYETIVRLLNDGLIERVGEQTIGEGKVRKMYRRAAAGNTAARTTLEAHQTALDRLRRTLHYDPTV